MARPQRGSNHMGVTDLLDELYERWRELDERAATEEPFDGFESQAEVWDALADAKRFLDKLERALIVGSKAGNSPRYVLAKIVNADKKMSRVAYLLRKEGGKP